MVTYTPTYLRTVHGFNAQLIGLFSGVPHLCRISFAAIFSIFIDYLLKNQKMSRTNARKLAGGIATIVHGLMIVGLAFSGCNQITAITFLVLATTMHGSFTSGMFANLIDLR